MLQNEFFERTGIQLSTREYRKVDAMYIAAGDIDKDTFCEDWKKHKDSVLLQEYYNRIRFLSSAVDRERKEKEELAHLVMALDRGVSQEDLRDRKSVV